MLFSCRLKKDIDNIISILNSDNDANKSTSAKEKLESCADIGIGGTVHSEQEIQGTGESAAKEKKCVDSKESCNGSTDALVIITSLVTSCIRYDTGFQRVSFLFSFNYHSTSFICSLQISEA